MNKKKLMIIIGIISFIVIVGGISYSYFVDNKDVGDVSLNTGEISIDLSGISGDQTLSNMIPQSDSDGMNSGDYFDFIERASKNDIGRIVKIYDLENNMDVRRLNKFGDYEQFYYFCSHLWDRGRPRPQRWRARTPAFPDK